MNDDVIKKLLIENGFIESVVPNKYHYPNGTVAYIRDQVCFRKNDERVMCVKDPVHVSIYLDGLKVGSKNPPMMFSCFDHYFKKN
ncbi:hypothetical protein CH380_19370 [Leptospira adleri]|uniref:Uncharacterized protein n=1 Tax=Leptospira adleri TaxID=2023186 RepID=A0A2M9YJ93_9LEPT|nr:hypothetical protein CH380_19370 [Leptospira adleri]PJZ61883.1 hypothetical protein CH376_10795 [Leptospira adleri]